MKGICHHAQDASLLRLCLSTLRLRLYPRQAHGQPPRDTLLRFKQIRFGCWTFHWEFWLNDNGPFWTRKSRNKREIATWRRYSLAPAPSSNLFAPLFLIPNVFDSSWTGHAINEVKPTLLFSVPALFNKIYDNTLKSDNINGTHVIIDIDECNDCNDCNDCNNRNVNKTCKFLCSNDEIL